MEQSVVSSATLIRAGFNHISRAIKDAARLNDTLETARANGYDCAWSVTDFLEWSRYAADPDSALWHVADISHKLCSTEHEGIAQLFFGGDEDEISRVIAICGVSDFLGRFLTSEISLLAEVLEGAMPRLDMPVDTHAKYDQQVQTLRMTYWRNILHIVADDAMSANPLDIQPVVSKRMSTLIDATLRSALIIAQQKVPNSNGCKFAVFAMGKLGAEEINYVSDVDLVYLVDKTEDFSGDLIAVGTHIGSTLQAVCSAIIPGVTAPSLWDIDTALRPEGKAGALVRTVESAKVYYTNWAENWEFQALLKARFVAGDDDVARDFENLIHPLVWSASSRKNFVYDCRAMRRRVEEHIAMDHKDREIKLGKGGLRDVEFTVQMLQLVHGRTDEHLHTKNTLESLKVLAHRGYVNREQAHDLSEDYRFLRVLEHRQQLWNMRRTHLFPKISSGSDSIDIFTRTRRISDIELAQNSDILRLARSLSLTPRQLVERFDSVRRQVRQLHMDIYYRPMLPNISQMSDDDITLTEEAMRARFESVGFADPEAAMRHVHVLTSGISRSSRINQILLPTILLWIGNGQNPDMGLMMWRRWVETYGGSGPYLGFLRDSPTALKRMCHVLANSRYLSDAIMKSPESVTWLGDESLLAPRSSESLHKRTDMMLQRFADSQTEFSTLLRALRRREIERVGLGWMSSVISSQDALKAMTRVYDVIIDAALEWATAKICADEQLDFPLSRMAVIAMGRYGGEEINFSSDADLMLVYEAHEGSEDIEARQFAQKQAELLREVLSGFAGTEQKLDLDMDLRPEGKNGPIVRSYASYSEYYASWSQTWEKQALLRARFAAGDKELGQRFINDIANPIRYNCGKLTEQEINSIQKLKARMESERLPRGVRNDRHIKLGKGGLSDVEWTVQLLQLQYAYQWEELQTTHTLDALDILERREVLCQHDAKILRHTWKLCTDLRNASFLWSGRVSQADIIPDDYFDMGGIAVCLGHSAHRGLQFMDDIIRTMRKCREVVNRLFYGA
ncbi:bifunctional [glutamine synthetase] adenylyltransferase/[glutamine synthetase]-adenylyl-L-tyrosine phosphorylase [Alloscardovia theropitheci]|uniref:Bifunctional [glutamine synthetase] adenylyltransferase/[glutamine synthetase]-adenylyl-L-tyrosine phosphorylase n=1 Tax=Alloscardovia theropitheci TaxID=2496842 RepID=A0A4R0QTA6_9BIFI|nr:bifunctional [glutamine synthetase] adenylyltransferase/[glutamine synthetase]-adenylyl-L-tyrosine phosphorylase [Alloscardovia theropitheci]TCD54748.1 bifunctional [glutamine synthetase] adenylyltransferase/[glutamine synthetase]-adenylyl-L-tyrosine phosphorylase [Alloscardovia theropitheci]